MWKSIKRLVFVAILLYLTAFGCHKDPYGGGSGRRANVVSREELAKEAVIALWESINISSLGTKTTMSRPVISSIESIDYPVSKSASLSEAQAYLLNFRNNEGFSVVQFKEGFPVVLALTEKGFFDKDKLFIQSATFESEAEAVVYGMVEDALSETSLPETKGGWRPGYHANTYPSSEEYGVWYTDTIVHPIVHVKWGQEYPFNMNMPETPSSIPGFGPTSSYRGRYAVGCVIVAAMQIMTATEHPYSITVGGNTYNLYMFSDVSFYGNCSQFAYNVYDDSVSTYLKSKTSQLAYLMYYFGQQIGATYLSNGETSAYYHLAMNYLADLDPQMYGGYDVQYVGSGSFNYLTAIDQMLNNGKPLMVSGARERVKYVSGVEVKDTVGHAWVADGYLYRHKNIDDDISYTQHLVHFNWGYRGVYDGYYYDANISHRQLTDTSYDTNSGTYLPSRNYCLYTKYYPY